ncbi:ABC transporter permease [Micromonospora sp. WMMD710]|uniref:FtsX-like permease family protein n=1 Tax=Micromonospora sp. WMMD710 TaxID=3016085 RepID=UPI0024164D8D|nr:ABC transporter permease [Micromonospora sp. WMMD710]MDG4757573.1 ABC transporter permease [Micromonospora sp. WMMD710]
MRATVLRTQVSVAARRPGRLILTGLAILVAAFVVFGTVLVQEITERTVRDNLSGTPAATDLVIGDPEQPSPTAAQLQRVRALTGVAEAVGRSEIGVSLGEGYLNLRADPGSGPLATVRVIRGSYPTRPGEIAITPRTAERLGLAVGTATSGTGGELTAPTQLTVTGVVETGSDGGSDAYAPDNVVTAWAHLNTVERIDVRVTPGTSPESVREAVTALVGATQPVRSGAEVRQTEANAAAEQVGRLFVLVGVFVAIAVIAAALVVTSTFRIVFAQRMRQLALLRAVGAGRGTLVGALTAEGALTGLVAGVVGVAGALALGYALPAVLRASGRAVSSPGLPLTAAVAVVAGAVMITVLAVLAPALSAARVSPLEALRTASTTAGRRGVGVPRLVCGLLLAAGAVLAAVATIRQLPTPEQESYDPTMPLLLLVGSGALAFFALVALGPLLVRPVLAVLGWPLRQLGPHGRLAVGGVGGTPRRAAAVSVVVALGVTLISGVVIGGASMRVLADREMALSAPTDFEVTTSDGTLPAAVVTGAEVAQALDRVVPYRRVADVTVLRGTDRLGDVESGYPTNDLDVAALPTTGDLDVAQGSLADRGPGRIVLNSWVARDTGLRAGDTATLARATGRVDVRVAAVLPGDGPLHAGILVDPADLDRLGVPAAYTGLLADAADAGEDGRTAGVRALRQAIGGSEGVGLAVLADERDRNDALLSTLVWIAVGLVGLTVLIAVVGVGSTTALSVVERVRESGLLRAIGLSRAGLRTMLTAESGLYGVIGATIGLLLGVPYAWLAVQTLGIDAPLTVPVPPLVGLFVALVALTALAGVLPARRASRVSPVVALGLDG